MACRECDVASALGMALQIAKNDNIKSKELEELFIKGYTDEIQVENAFDKFYDEVNDIRKDQVRVIQCFLYPTKKYCKKINKK
jgi:hypothetical protein